MLNKKNFIYKDQVSRLCNVMINAQALFEDLEELESEGLFKQNRTHRRDVNARGYGIRKQYRRHYNSTRSGMKKLLDIFSHFKWELAMIHF